MARTGSILMVDDEQDLLRMSSQTLRREGHTVETASNAKLALEMVEQHAFDVILLDLRMAGMDGMAFLRQYVERPERAEVIMLTAHSSVESAVEAMKLGAFGYLNKPFQAEAVIAEINRILEIRALRSQNRALRDAAARSGLEKLIGEHESMQRVRQSVLDVAPTEMPILVRGETGTGKELVARAIHQASQRSDKPMVSCNCAAFATGLLESELFGHVRGAFTGALSDRVGRFEEADGGTLFLDEVGDLSAEAQVRLLRVLQEGEFERVGSNKKQTVDVRIVAATHKDVEQEIADGQFREDLYYRIAGATIEVPPLRERRSDLSILCEEILRRCSKSMGRDVEEFTSGAMRKIENHDWPGNVRELENVIAHAVATVSSMNIAANEIHTGGPGHQRRGAQGDSYVVAGTSFGEAREDFERQYIGRVLDETDGNVSETARRLGVDRRQLQRKMQRLRMRTQD